MRVRSRKFVLLTLGLIVLFSFGGCEKIRRKSALKKAVQAVSDSVEYQQLLNILSDRKDQCLLLIYEEACDSDYVTCVEDAWVVYMKIPSECVLHHEERLQVSMLIDYDGKIISRYPGEEYFKDRQYCVNQDECYRVSVDVKQGAGACENFINAKLRVTGGYPDPSCQCVGNRCAAE